MHYAEQKKVAIVFEYSATIVQDSQSVVVDRKDHVCWTQLLVGECQLVRFRHEPGWYLQFVVDVGIPFVSLTPQRVSIFVQDAPDTFGLPSFLVGVESESQQDVITVIRLARPFEPPSGGGARGYYLFLLADFRKQELAGAPFISLPFGTMAMSMPVIAPLVSMVMMMMAVFLNLLQSFGILGGDHSLEF